MGGAAGAPHPLPIYFMSKMHTKTIQKIQKAYIKTYEKDVKIYKDVEPQCIPVSSTIAVTNA